MKSNILIALLIIAIGGWAYTFYCYTTNAADYSDLKKQHSRCDSAEIKFRDNLAAKDYIIIDLHRQLNNRQVMTNAILKNLRELAFATNRQYDANAWMRNETIKP